MKRYVDMIVIHCSATRENQDITIQDIDKWHRARGFKKVGYHFYITKDGVIHIGRTLDEMGAHAKDYNDNSVGICYEGGLDVNGKAADTRTYEQKAALRALVSALRSLIPSIVRVVGHRDLSVDINGDGVISPKERMKECPCFDMKDL